MKSILLSFAITCAVITPSLASPKSYEPVELCRPRTNNVLRKTAQWLAYPTTRVCTRPYIRVHNSLTRSRSLPEFINNMVSPHHRFQDESGNKAKACPTAKSPNKICF